MSKGLGKLQREILETLDIAKAETWNYRGSARERNCSASNTWKWDKPGWVMAGGKAVRLADHVYDLRASTRYLHNKRGLQFIEGAFQAAFSRAVKGLVHRGYLLHLLSLVPLAEADINSNILMLSDGLYLPLRIGNNKQIRFVTKA